uniref:C2H2-type domain-containing protein n=1 Tax=Acrobeloides nanus TaxID=290746 RepID=A0A914EFJ1_9BILA
MDSKCMKDEVPDILTSWTDKIDFRLYDSLSLDEQNCSKLQSQDVDKPVTKDLMNECSNCYRTFSTSDEMALHYEKIHSESRRVSYYYCFACPRVFLNRNVRDQHIITHFSALMNTVMYNIDNSQLNVQGRNLILL